MPILRRAHAGRPVPGSERRLLQAGVRGSGTALQPWGELEGDGLEKAVRRSGRPAFVAMMEPADFGQLDDLTHSRGLDFSRVGSIFVQGEVGSRELVLGEVGMQNAAEMCLAKDDHVIEVLAPDRTDEALDVRILPGRLRRIGATLQEDESSHGEDIRHRSEDCYLLDG